MELLESLNQWHWFGFAAFLGILEVTLGASFFLLWLAVCACGVAVLLIIFPMIEWQYQLLVFAIGAIACIFFWYTHLKNNPASSDKPRLNRRSEQYIGYIFTLTEPIVNGRGKIRVDDSFWKIEGPDLPIGTKVKVIDVNGVILKVEKES